MFKSYSVFLILLVVSFPLSFCNGIGTLNEDRGKSQTETEDWPDDSNSPKLTKNESIYYEEDIRSEIQSYFMDEEAQEVLTSSTSAGIIKLSTTTTAAKTKCTQNQIEAGIEMASEAIKNSVSLLQTARKYKNATARCRRLVNQMPKWLNDADALLKGHDFKRASNKLKAVTNNIAFVQKLAAKPASHYILDAISQVNIVKAASDFLTKCIPPKVQFVQNLISSPLLQVPNPTPYSYMKPEIIDSENAQIDGNDFNISIDNKIDSALVKSFHSFESGIFTVFYKCPSNFPGIISGFYLRSSDDHTHGDGIVFDVLGNRPDRVRVGTVSNGRIRASAIDLGLDCSKKYHEYTVIWEKDTIMWLFDKEILRSMTRNDPNSASRWPNAQTLSVYAEIKRHGGWGVGTYDPSHSPFLAGFTDLRITSPIHAKTLPQVPFWPRTSYPLTKFGIDYCREGVTRLETNDEITIPFKPSGVCDGGRFVSPKRYNYGEFSASIRCPSGNASGLVTSFYLSSFEGGSRYKIQDEIDFEFLGKNHTGVQATYFVNGKSIAAAFVDLGYDCSADFHLYTIRWSSAKIEWFVDKKLKHVALNDGVKPYPTKPSYLYGSLWNANNGWAGKYFGKNAPYFARYKNIVIISPLS